MELQTDVVFRAVIENKTSKNQTFRLLYAIPSEIQKQ